MIINNENTAGLSHNNLLFLNEINNTIHTARNIINEFENVNLNETNDSIILSDEFLMNDASNNNDDAENAVEASPYMNVQVMDDSKIHDEVKKRKIIRKRKDELTKKSTSVNVSLTFSEFLQSVVDLKTYKIVELKAVAKHNKLHITGNKTILIERIHLFFKKNIAAVNIQSCMRRFFVKRSFQLRGPAYINRSMCVNDTDFFTMEPLSEIPFQEFFSYTDESSFTYGFNICSLMTLLIRKGRNIFNPYNRAKITENVIGDMIRLYLYLVILFPENINEEDKILRTRNQYIQPVNHILLFRGHYYGFGSQNRSSSFFARNRTDSIQWLQRELNEIETGEIIPINQHIRFDELTNIDDVIPENIVSMAGQHDFRRERTNRDDVSENRRFVQRAFVQPSLDASTTFSASSPNATVLRTSASGSHVEDDNVQELEIHSQQYQIHIQNIGQKMREITSRPISVRIQELFMEIDQLGNYTELQWFLQLNKREYFLLYGNLFDTWRYRGQLPFSVKNRICPLGDPFLHIMPPRMRMDEVTEQQLQIGCITVMERLAYTAYDIEDRKLGALHILLALTVVSLPARENMIWLYESMY